MQGLISVIVPVYNVGQYLKPCVDSILRQTYPHLEIILVDDGSTDGSGEVCDGYKGLDPRIKVIHKQNGGLSDARNVGLDNASGDYIGFVDGDDMILPEMYQELVGLFHNFSGISIAACDDFLYWDGQALPSYREGTVYTLGPEEAIVQNLQLKFRPMACNKLYRRELFDSVRFPRGKTTEDVFIVLALLSKAKRVAVTDSGLYAYRQRAGSIQKSPSFRYFDMIAAHTQNLEFIQREYPHLEGLAKERLLVAYFDAVNFLLMYRVDNQDLKGYTTHISKNCMKLLAGRIMSPAKKAGLCVFLVSKTLYQTVMRRWKWKM